MANAGKGRKDARASAETEAFGAMIRGDDAHQKHEDEKLNDQEDSAGMLRCRLDGVHIFVSCLPVQVTDRRPVARAIHRVGRGHRCVAVRCGVVPVARTKARARRTTHLNRPEQ
jgi:hypothetical protein